MKIVNGILQDVSIDGVEFIVDIIPKGRKRRPAIPMNPKYITIHNTGGNNVPADNYRRSQLDITQDKSVSWHFAIDEKTIVQSLPINEVAWHAGNQNGNYNSFGIEVCERNGAEEVAVKFVAELLKTLNMNIDNVKPHKFFSGKQCPWKILPHWDKFINDIKNVTSPIKTANSTSISYKTAIIKLTTSGIISTPSAWTTPSLKFIEGLILKVCEKKYGAKDYSTSIKALVDNKVINSPTIWNEKTYTETNVSDMVVKLSSLF